MGKVGHAGWGTTRHKRVNDCHPDRKHYANGLCWACYRNTPQSVAQRQQYYRDNLHRFQAQYRKQRERRQKEEKRYGISRADQLAMLEAQGHRCLICGVPDGHLKKRLGIDHCHETGRVRGFLCLKCNNGLGLFRDDWELVAKAAYYLYARRHNSLRSA